MPTVRHGGVPDSGEDDHFARELGVRLRQARVVRGLTLQDVAAATGNEFKPSALGAYERGQRGIPIVRLVRLAAFYQAGLAEILPTDDEDAVIDLTGPSPWEHSRITVDLARMRDMDLGGPKGTAMLRLLEAIRLQRADRPAQWLSLRVTDLLLIAGALDVPQAQIRQRLDDLGVLAHRPTAGSRNPH